MLGKLRHIHTTWWPPRYCICWNNLDTQLQLSSHHPNFTSHPFFWNVSQFFFPLPVLQHWYHKPCTVGLRWHDMTDYLFYLCDACFMPDASSYLMCPSRPIGERSAVTRMKNSLAASGKELQLLAGGWELLSRHHLCPSWSHFWLSCLGLTCWTMQTVCRVTPICPCSLALKHLLVLLYLSVHVCPQIAHLSSHSVNSSLGQKLRSWSKLYRSTFMMKRNRC